ncbi:hypothetical protein CEXT_179121, partial [Caerostris extrusa]
MQQHSSMSELWLIVPTTIQKTRFLRALRVKCTTTGDIRGFYILGTQMQSWSGVLRIFGMEGNVYELRRNLPTPENHQSLQGAAATNVTVFWGGRQALLTGATPD